MLMLTFEVGTEFVPFLCLCFGCLHSRPSTLDWFIKIFVWNLKKHDCAKMFHFDIQTLVRKCVLVKYCSFREPPFYKAEHTGRNCLNQVWVITFDHSALAT